MSCKLLILPYSRFAASLLRTCTFTPSNIKSMDLVYMWRLSSIVPSFWDPQHHRQINTRHHELLSSNRQLISVMRRPYCSTINSGERSHTFSSYASAPRSIFLQVSDWMLAMKSFYILQPNAIHAVLLKTDAPASGSRFLLPFQTQRQRNGWRQGGRIAPLRQRLGAKFLPLPVILTSAPSTKGVRTGSHNGTRYSYYIEAQIGSGTSVLATGKGDYQGASRLSSL